eukprot:10471602-Karenia_brevis.AAC.1
MVDLLMMKMRAMMKTTMTTTVIMKGKKARKKKSVSETNQLNLKREKLDMEMYLVKVIPRRSVRVKHKRSERRVRLPGK